MSWRDLIGNAPRRRRRYAISRPLSEGGKSLTKQSRWIGAALAGKQFPRKASRSFVRNLPTLGDGSTHLPESPLPGTSRELSGTIKRLRDVAPAGVTGTVEVLERQMKTTVLEEHKATQRVDMLVERLRDVDPEKIAEYDRGRSRLLRHVAELETKIAHSTSHSLNLTPTSPSFVASCTRPISRRSDN